MTLHVRIERVRVTGVDAPRLRRVLRRLPALLERRLQGRRFAGASLPSLRAVAASDDADDLAAALADALARGLP